MEKARLNQDLVFSNNLITDKIWPHLNFSDLKATREVSWDFFDKITRFDGFQNSAVLIVSKESVEIPNLFDKNSSSSMTQTWTGLQIEVDLPLDVLDKIRHILQHVKFLSLVISPLDPEFALFRGHNQNYANFIAGVLSSTPKLTSLQMHICLLENLTEVWTSAAIRDHLRNLQTLEMFLLDLGGNSTKAMYRTNGPLLKRATKNTDFFVISEECAVNLQQLATALVETAPPCRLKRLWIPKFLYKSSAETGNPHAELRLRRSVLDLLRSHRGSLVEVSIPLAVWNDPGDIATVTLPQLKSLTTIVSPDDTVTFETFLLHHPKLEELHLQLDVSDYEREDVDTDIWKAIKRRCAAGGAYLKKVHLKTEDYFWTYCKEGVVHDWSFLEEMEALKDFLVEILMGLASVSWREALGIGPRVLECLPRNQLKSLSLLGIHCKGSFWRSSPEGREVEVSEEVPSESKLKLLRGFQNLKRLSFRHSVNAVDDDVIQFIFREMTALEELEVSHCERLTDAGMSGTGPEDERLSIQSLKGLKMLSICSCPSVTPEGLLSALALPFLQHFEYYTRTPVPKSFVWGIAAQNPSLESISVHFTTGDTDNPEPNDNNPVDIDNLAWSAEEKKAFFDKHPRIKALVNLKSLGVYAEDWERRA